MVTKDSLTQKPLLIASLQIANVPMQEKKAETVVKPCLKMIANLLQGGKKAVDKGAQIHLSNDTMKRRSTIIVEDLKQQLIAKLKKSFILCSSV